MLEKLSYAFTEIRQKGSDPRWWRDRMNVRLNSTFQQNVWPGQSGIDIPDADWDNLIVLDACRRDLFEEVVDLGQFDEYRTVTSRGSATKEWCKKNWNGEHGDVAYVTSNPVPSRSIPGSVHELHEVWRDSFDGEGIGTVPAKSVTEAVLDAHSEYPQKRLVAHYLQPHFPFVTRPDLQFTSWEGTPEMNLEGRNHLPNDIWDALDTGHVDQETVWEGYRENLEYVLEEVWKLVDKLDGKTIITTDHGNAIGERSFPIPVKTYGHPPNFRLKPLVEVPWAVIGGERRDIVAGSATDTRIESDIEQVEEQLEALGYA